MSRSRKGTTTFTVEESKVFVEPVETIFLNTHQIPREIIEVEKAARTAAEVAAKIAAEQVGAAAAAYDDDRVVADDDVLSSKQPVVRSISIVKPPGTTLLQFVRIFTSANQYQATFEPAVADWQEEYFYALDENKKLKRTRFTARLRIMSVHTRHFLAISKVFGIDPALRLITRVGKAVTGK